MNEKNIILIEEDPQCGWCHQSLENEDPAVHALFCPEQPLNVYRRELEAQLIKEYGVNTKYGLPGPLYLALFAADKAIEDHLRTKKWSFEEKAHAQH